MADLTPDEISFFATGELPASLAAEQPAVQTEVAPVEEIPATLDIAPVVETPAIAPTDAAELLRRSLAEEQTRRIQAELQMKQIQQQLEEKTKPVVPAPDPSQDPLGAMMHQQNQIAAQLAELQGRLNQTQQDSQLKNQFEQFAASVRSIKEAYEKVVPDFNDAYQHVRNTRAADLRMLGMPEANINQTLLQDEMTIAQNALQNGKNPAEEVYNMAKRHGYTPKQATAAGTAQAKIDSIIAGQAADKNPGRAGHVGGEITLDSLKAMGHNDLTKVVMDDKQWANLVGGKSHDIF